MVITRSSHKRARSAADEFVGEVGNMLQQDELSPTSRKNTRELHTKVARMSYDDTQGWESARGIFDLVKHSAEKSQQIQELKAGLNAAEKEANIKEIYDHEMWLLKVGDWHGDILSIVMNRETDARAKEFKALKDELKARKTPKKEYHTKTKYCSPLYFNGRVQDYFPKVKAEMKMVKQWRQAGEDPATAPLTPHLTRLEFVVISMNESLRAGHQASSDSVLKAMEGYFIRNNLAHHPPPRPDSVYSEKEGKVDWEAMYWKCQQHKKNWKNDCANGNMSKEDCDHAINMVNLWFNCHVAKFGRKQAVPTRLGQDKELKASEDAKKAKRKMQERRQAFSPRIRSYGHTDRVSGTRWSHGTDAFEESG